MITRLRVFVSRVCDPFIRRRRERRLADEMQAHLDLLSDEYQARGLSAGEARLAARKAFGGVDQIKERYRDKRGLPGLDAIVQDAKHALRLMARDRWVTAAVVVALSLGIGMSTFVLSVLYGMNLRALPFENADAIVIAAGEPNRTQGMRLPVPVFEAWRAGARSFVAMGGEVDAPATLGDEGTATDQFGGTFISHNVFSILGVQPVLGRDFRPEDDRTGAPLAVLIGHRIWTERYGLDPAVIGRSVKVNGQPGVVIGVMPDGFMYPVDTQVWRPLAFLPAPASGQPLIRVLARLREGVTAAQARDELAAIVSSLDRVPDADRQRRTVVMPLNQSYFGPTLQPVPLMMLAAVFVVLLIGCSHAAILLLTRSAARSREMSLRTALGAGRSRIIRQLLLESLLMAMLAGVAGFAMAYFGVQRFAQEVRGFGMPYWARFTFDLRLFSFFALVCVGTGVVFGLVPAWHTSRANLNELLNQSGRSGTAAPRTRRLTNALIVLELALTMVLLTTAFLLVQSARVVSRDDHTMDVANLWQFQLSLPQPQYASIESRRRFYQRLDERLRSGSGFESAALGSAPPFARSDSALVMMDAQSDASTARPSRMVAIGSRYFQTLDLPIRRGASLDDLDTATRQGSALVNVRFVEVFSRESDPIGRKVGVVNERDPGAPEWFTIVGIAPSIRHSPASGVQPVVYLPHDVHASAFGTIIVRGNPAAFAEGLRQDIRRLDPDLPVYDLLSLARLSEMSRWIQRITSSVLSLVAVIAFVLSTLGLYAITAYHASQRTKEVGVRMALGSRASQVSWLFLRGALVQLAIGLAIGIPGALAAGQLIQGVLVQTRGSDPLTLAMISLVLVIVAVAASILPARRASRLDPVAALRHD